MLHDYSQGKRLGVKCGVYELVQWHTKKVHDLAEDCDVDDESVLHDIVREIGALLQSYTTQLFRINMLHYREVCDSVALLYTNPQLPWD